MNTAPTQITSGISSQFYVLCEQILLILNHFSPPWFWGSIPHLCLHCPFSLLKSGVSTAQEWVLFFLQVIQAVFFGICVLTDLSSLLTKGNDSQEQERQLKKLISLRDWMMAVLAFPIGVVSVVLICMHLHCLDGCWFSSSWNTFAPLHVRLWTKRNMMKMIIQLCMCHCYKMSPKFLKLILFITKMYFKVKTRW